MRIEEQKMVVQAVYPTCKCHEYMDVMGTWFMLYEEKEGSALPDYFSEKPIAYSFVSEEQAWDRAARDILHNMVKKLEV